MWWNRVWFSRFSVRQQVIIFAPVEINTIAFTLWSLDRVPTCTQCVCCACPGKRKICSLLDGFKLPVSEKWDTVDLFVPFIVFVFFFFELNINFFRLGPKGHSPVLHCASLLRIISRVISICALKNDGFFFVAEPRHGVVNRHFLKNEYSDLSFFLLFWIESYISLCKRNMGQFSVLSNKQSSKTWI